MIHITIYCCSLYCCLFFWGNTVEALVSKHLGDLEKCSQLQLVAALMRAGGGGVGVARKKSSRKSQRWVTVADDRLRENGRKKNVNCRSIFLSCNNRKYLYNLIVSEVMVWVKELFPLIVCYIVCNLS